MFFITVWCKHSNCSSCLSWSLRIAVAISTAFHLALHLNKNQFVHILRAPPTAKQAAFLSEMTNVNDKSYRENLIRVFSSKKIQNWILKSQRIRKRTFRFFTRQINPTSLESWCVKGTEECTSRVDSSVPLTHHDLQDLVDLLI